MIHFFNHCAYLGRDTPFVMRFHHDYDAAFGRVIHDALVCLSGAVHHPEYFARTALAAKCADQSRAQIGCEVYCGVGLGDGFIQICWVFCGKFCSGSDTGYF